ncbi:flavodoxin (plasmid) [Rhizobium sp. ACO-34A]|nr:flavodoxin [Rhizobium sp. ACO-34A]ATN37198.1 flavodoxin [Rhizobium sp. ACO-34A]
MNPQNDLSRRKLLAAPSLLMVAAGLGASSSSAPAAGQADSSVLVACFSRSGNTRVIAGQIRRALGARSFDIEPAAPYPEDYEETVAQAERERRAQYRPPLKAMADMEGCETVFLGFPIWGMTAPAIIRSFLAAHDFRGRTLIPFITHGGYGLGNSLSVVATHAPQADILDGFSMEADQERRTLTEVTGWLGGVSLPK